MFKEDSQYILRFYLRRISAPALLCTKGQSEDLKEIRLELSLEWTLRSGKNIAGCDSLKRALSRCGGSLSDGEAKQPSGRLPK